jgi:hypothetical protein
MKTKYSFLSTILIIQFSLSMFGQTTTEVKTKTTTLQNEISDALGKPVFESIVDTLNTKVWIITQNQYKEIMKTKMGETMDEMKDTTMPTTKATEKALSEGTHYFIFDVTNITTGIEIADTSAKVAIVSPSEKTFSVNLQPMMSHFGGGISLDEKGEYLFTINLNVGSGYKTSQFKYKLR